MIFPPQEKKPVENKLFYLCALWGWVVIHAFVAREQWLFLPRGKNRIMISNDFFHLEKKWKKLSYLFSVHYGVECATCTWAFLCQWTMIVVIPKKKTPEETKLFYLCALRGWVVTHAFQWLFLPRRKKWIMINNAFFHLLKKWKKLSYLFSVHYGVECATCTWAFLCQWTMIVVIPRKKMKNDKRWFFPSLEIKWKKLSYLFTVQYAGLSVMHAFHVSPSENSDFCYPEGNKNWYAGACGNGSWKLWNLYLFVLIKVIEFRGEFHQKKRSLQIRDYLVRGIFLKLTIKFNNKNQNRRIL